MSSSESACASVAAAAREAFDFDLARKDDGAAREAFDSAWLALTGRFFGEDTVTSVTAALCLD
jgi:hypothetical protein